MDKQMVVVLASHSIDDLQKQITEFIEKRKVSIINVAHSSCYNEFTKKMSFSVAIAYTEQ